MHNIRGGEYTLDQLHLTWELLSASIIVISSKMTVYRIAGSMMIIIFPRSPVQASRWNVFIVFVKCTPKFSCVCNFPGAFMIWKVKNTWFRVKDNINSKKFTKLILKKVMSTTKQYVYIASTDIYIYIYI
jgi:hypothetical protein